jgi:hypothetical protein
MQPKALTGDTTFVARLDGEEVAADEAFGHRYARTRSPRPARTVAGGRSGRAASLDQALTFDARHHVSAESGRITCHVRAGGGTLRGTLLAIGRDLSLLVDRGKLKLLGAKRRTIAEGALPWGQAPAWHAVEIAWRDRRLRVAADGAQILVAELDQPLPIRPMGRGLAIENYRTRIRATRLTFGPLGGALLDDLVMAKP